MPLLHLLISLPRARPRRHSCLARPAAVSSDGHCIPLWVSQPNVHRRPGITSWSASMLAASIANADFPTPGVPSMRDHALQVISSGADARRWQDAEPRIRARRAAVLAGSGTSWRARSRPASPYGGPRATSRPPSPVTSWRFRHHLAGSTCWRSGQWSKAGTARSRLSACSTSTGTISRPPGIWRSSGTSQPGAAGTGTGRPSPGGRWTAWSATAGPATSLITDSSSSARRPRRRRPSKRR